MASATDRQYQTFWRRFWAGWIDAAIFLPLGLLDFWLDHHLHFPAVATAWVVVYTLSFEIYSVAMHANYGQTLGKMAMRVKVLDLTERKLSLRQALLRDSVPIVLGLLALFEDLPIALSGASRYDSQNIGIWMQLNLYGSFLWFAAELLTMLTNSKRRALHDFIAGSVVVRSVPVDTPVEPGVAAG